MQRQHSLAALLVLTIIAVGSWAYVTQPASKPTPSKTQVSKAPSALLTEMEENDKKDAAKAARLTPSQIAKIRKKSGQTEVRGMVKIRRDQFPTTFVAERTHDDDYCSVAGGFDGAWAIYQGATLIASAGTPNGWSADSSGVVSGPSNPATGVYTGYGDNVGACTVDTSGDGTLSQTFTFTVTGDLTGSVSVTGQSYTTTSNTVNIALKADTATGLEVVSAAVSSGGGTGDTTTTPDVQHYTDSLTLTYDTEGDYTISVTYTDNQSPTANTLTVTQDIHVCFPTSEEIADYVSAWGGAAISPSLKLVRTSKTFDSGTGLYTSCYKVGVSYDGTNFVTSSNQGSWFTSTGWTLPDNATTSDSLSNNVGPINFCIQTPTGEESDSLDQVECRTYTTTELCGTVIGLPFFRYTLPTSATRTGAGGGFWMMM